MIKKPIPKKLIFYSLAIAIFLSIFYILVSALNKSTDQQKQLEPQTNQAGGLNITAMTINTSGRQNATFELVFDTHEGDLVFDFTSQAVLIVNSNREYQPISWDGGSGGHHLSGKLTFPPLPKAAKTMKLVIKDFSGVKERIFSWQLK